MEEAASFLDRSQTFLGVLITLNILCIFASKDDTDSSLNYEISESNFILRFLHYYKVRFCDRLIELEQTIRTSLNAFSNSTDYRRLKSIVEYPEKYAPEVGRAAYRLQLKYSYSLNERSYLVTSGYVLLDKVEASNESRRAPLYTLLFGILFFFVDELCNLLGSDAIEISVIFGWFFIALSSIYWIAIWGFFFFRNDLSGRREMPEKNRSKLGNIKSIVKKVTPFKGSFLKFLLCFLIAYCGLKYCPLTISSKNWYLVYVAAVSLLPITMIGIMRSAWCSVKGSYSLMHVLGHLLAYIVYAGIFTLMIVSDFRSEIMSLEFFQDIKGLRFAIILFSLLNGLILPFCIPYLKLKNLYKIEMENLNRMDNEINRKRDLFSQELGDLCKEIVEIS